MLCKNAKLIAFNLITLALRGKSVSSYWSQTIYVRIPVYHFLYDLGQIPQLENEDNNSTHPHRGYCED